MYDIVCYGSISLDISGKLESPLKPGTQISTMDYLMSPGGDAALVALILAGLGWKVALCGNPVANDPAGHYLRSIFEEAGVSLYAEGPGKTSMTAITVDPDGSRSSITYHDNIPEDILPVPADLIKGSRFLYADGCYGLNSAAAAMIAKENDVPSLLSFDVPSLANVKLFDVVVASEAVSSTFVSDPEEAAKYMYTQGPSVSIVTMGDRGSVYYDGRIHRVPANRICQVDSTGAGAAFMAGLIHGCMSGMSLEGSVRIASLCGALKATVRGSYRRITREELADTTNNRITSNQPVV